MTEEWYSGWGQLAVYSTLQHNWLNGDFLDEVTHISVWQGVYVSQSSIVTHFHLPSSYGWWLYLGTEKLARWKRHWFKWDGEFHKTFDMIEQMSQLLYVVCLYWMEMSWHHLSLWQILHMDCSGESLHEMMIELLNPELCKFVLQWKAQSVMPRRKCREVGFLLLQK